MTDKIDLEYVLEAFDSDDPDMIDAVIDDFIKWAKNNKISTYEEMKKNGIDVKKITEEVIMNDRDKINKTLDKYRPKESIVFTDDEEREKHR